MYYNPAKFASLPLGVVLRRSPGITKWAKWSWKAVAVLPGAGEANWREVRRDGDHVEYHAATVLLELHGSDTEAYLTGISDSEPSVFVILRESDKSDHGLEVLLVTASPFEAQDYADSGEEIIEKVLMPEGLVAWIRDFSHEHHVEEPFKKRKRDKKEIGGSEDGIGDSRISQMADVYRAPKRRLQ